MKKIISAVLFISLLLSMFGVVSVYADDEFVSLPINNGEKILKYDVIKDNDDYLMKLSDLQTLSDYEVKTNKNLITFIRGAKKVEIDTDAKTLHPLKGTANISKITSIGIKNVNGTYYLSMSQVLPWLNVLCSTVCLRDDSSVLWVSQDNVSYWDIIDDFNWEDVSFDFLTECIRGDVYSKDVQYAAYIKSKGLSGSIMNLIPIDWGASYGGYKDYYDILEEMLQDKSRSIHSVSTLLNETKKVNSIFKFIEHLGELENLPDELQALAAMSKGVENVKYVKDYFIFFDTFQHMDQKILDIPREMSLHRMNANYPKELESALNTLLSSYTNPWSGLKTTFVHNLLEMNVEKLIKSGEDIPKVFTYCKDVLKIKDNFTPKWEKGVNRVPCYEELARSGLNVMRKKYIYPISVERAHILMYLYSTEKSYEAMQLYYSTHNNTKLAKSYDEKIKICREWYGRFMATAYSEQNDSHNYNDDVKKETYTEAIRKMFKKIDLYADITLDNPSSSFAPLKDVPKTNAIGSEVTLSQQDQDSVREIFENDLVLIGEYGERKYIPIPLTGFIDPVDENNWPKSVKDYAVSVYTEIDIITMFKNIYGEELSPPYNGDLDFEDGYFIVGARGYPFNEYSNLRYYDLGSGYYKITADAESFPQTEFDDEPVRNASVIIKKSSDSPIGWQILAGAIK